MELACQLAAGSLQSCSIFSKTLFLGEESLPACLTLGNPRRPLGAEGVCSEMLGKVNGRGVGR